MQITWQSSAGDEITFSSASDTYKLLKQYDGFSTAFVQHQTVMAPYQNGATWLDTRFTERQLSFHLMVVGASLEDIQDAILVLTRMFNPLGGPGILTFTHENGTEYHLTCIGNNTPTVDPNSRSTRHQLVRINLVAFDPFWYVDGSVVNIGTSTAATFPLVFPFVLPSNVAQAVALNSGDVEAPVTIVITGDVTNPVLTNSTTGKALTFALDMDASDVLTITTGFGNKTITFYDATAGTTVNGFQYLSAASEFWQLSPGNNTLSFTATSVDAATTCTVTWSDRYSGV